MYNHYVIFFSFLFQIMNLVRTISTSMYLFHHYLFELNRYIFTNFFYFYFKSSFFSFRKQNRAGLLESVYSHFSYLALFSSTHFSPKPGVSFKTSIPPCKFNQSPCLAGSNSFLKYQSLVSWTVVENVGSNWLYSFKVSALAMMVSLVEAFCKAAMMASGLNSLTGAGPLEVVATLTFFNSEMYKSVIMFCLLAVVWNNFLEDVLKTEANIMIWVLVE